LLKAQARHGEISKRRLPANAAATTGAAHRLAAPESRLCAMALERLGDLFRDHGRDANVGFAGDAGNMRRQQQMGTSRQRRSCRQRLMLVSQSKDTKHIAMPDITTCRECHVGARPVAGKVTSDCATCHKFHNGRDYWHGVVQAQMLLRGKK
jgi:hypothetical protein